MPTSGLQEIYVFYTAQGIRLIIGNIKENEEQTQIYTFNPEIEKVKLGFLFLTKECDSFFFVLLQFELLRIVPYFGCSSATGIILGADSLIALQQKLAPIQILKYFPEFDNYYHFQSFDLDEPVIALSVFYSGGKVLKNTFNEVFESINK